MSMPRYIWLRLKSDRRAVTALEYGLIAALIAAVMITSVTALGTDISNLFATLGTKINTADTAAMGGKAK